MNRLCLDIGKARIGIAYSYSTLASNLETLYCKNWTKDTNKIAEIAQKYSAEEIIVGLPLNMDGTESEMCNYVKQFCNMLKTKTTAKIKFFDERLTSIEAENIMHQANVKTSKKKGLIDQIAATIILQTYLDGLK
ncbi:MAG: Holliday junction resolvase RuvX [Christensenellales bacterium]